MRAHHGNRRRRVRHRSGREHVHAHLERSPIGYPRDITAPTKKARHRGVSTDECRAFARYSPDGQNESYSVSMKVTFISTRYSVI